MKCVCLKSVFVKSAPGTLAFMILLLPAPLANAQTGGRPTQGTSTPGGPVRPTPGGMKPTTNKNQQPLSVREREFQIAGMEREMAKPRTAEEEKLALAQIAEDFERIQMINNKMMSAAMSVSAPDYASVGDTTAEISKRAKRIRSNLRLPKANADEAKKPTEHKQAADAARMKAALLSLDGSIMSFIKNPIFKEPGVVDVEHSVKAGQDLETIIEFSQFISKDAERLRKTEPKPR